MTHVENSAEQYPTLDLVGVTLDWPPQLLTRVGTALVDAGKRSRHELGWLLEEAVHGNDGQRLYDWIDAVLDPPGTRISPDGPEIPRYGPARDAYESMGLTLFLSELSRLPRWQKRPLYTDRRDGVPATSGPTLTVAATIEGFVHRAGALAKHGYFDAAFGSPTHGGLGQADAEGNRQLRELIAVDADIWPLTWDTSRDEWRQPGWDWDADLLCDMIEALDHYVARPTRREPRGYQDSWGLPQNGWAYSDFDRAAGRAVYRWTVNELLSRSELGLVLATGGEEDGHLVHVTRDPRDQLVDQAKKTPQPAEAGTVDHAVALFRARGGGRDEKRSAVVALAGILERRRTLLKAELVSKDESALFHIANGFDLRHRDAKQLADYDGAFLDWVFWWYLATIELTDRILARPAETPPS